MQWPHMTSRELAGYLWWVGHAIDAWCTKWKEAHPGHQPQDTWKGVPPLVGLSESDYVHYGAGGRHLARGPSSIV